MTRHGAATDPTTAAFLFTTLSQEWTLYPTFARNLAPERLLAWIEPTAWRVIGPVALPSMERVRAAMTGRDPAQDNMAASYAEDIAKQIAEMKGEGKTTPASAAPEAKKNW